MKMHHSPRRAKVRLVQRQVVKASVVSDCTHEYANTIKRAMMICIRRQGAWVLPE